MGIADFGLQIKDALLEGRRAAEALMIDTCVVFRATDIVDELTGKPVYETIYEGKAKRQTYEANEVAITAGVHTNVVQRYKGHWPVGVFDPQIGDVVKWTATPMDPDMVGTKDRVAAIFHKSLATSMRLQLDSEVA